MVTYFNNEELQFISDRKSFLVKRSATQASLKFLEQLAVRSRMDDSLIMRKNSDSYKISRGENLSGFPYFVLDLPRLQEPKFIFSIRVILWWGNYISLNLLIGEEIIPAYRNAIIKNLNSLDTSKYLLSTANDFWQHDLNDREFYIPFNDVNFSALTKMNRMKISQQIDLSLVNKPEEVFKCIQELNGLLC